VPRRRWACILAATAAGVLIAAAALAQFGGRGPFLAAAPFAHGWGFGNPNFANAYTVMGNDLNAVIAGSKSTQSMLSDVSKALKGQ